MSDVLRALGEAAHEEAERHAKATNASLIAERQICRECTREWPCPSRSFADRVIRDLHADTREREARDQQIREHAEFVRRVSALVANEPDETSLEHRLLAIWQDAQAILALLAKPHTDTTNTGTEGT